MILTWNTVFPRIIAGGNYFFFPTKRGRLLEGGDYLKYCSLEVVPSILCYIFLLNQKKSRQYTDGLLTEHGLFSKYSKFSSLMNFQSLNRYWSVLLSLIALQLDRRDKRKRRWREGQGRDDYSWEAIYKRRCTVSSSTGHLQKARNLREGLGIDSWRGRFTWK